MQKSVYSDRYIKPEQLCVGLFVHLDLSWIKHPFSFSSFKIENQDQVKTIQNLGLPRIRYISGKSDCAPVDVDKESISTLENPIYQQVNAAVDAMPLEIKIEEGPLAKKHQMIQRMDKLDERIKLCERDYSAALETLKSMWSNIATQPALVSRQAKEVVGKIVDSELMQSEVAIHLMLDQKSGNDIFTHAMNVAVLSMMMAKKMGFSAEQIKLIGLGALFHDVGFIDAPYHSQGKEETLSAEQIEDMQQHCKKGVDICNQLQLPYESVLIVWQHHERVDGSGYPEKLKDHKVSPLSNIVAVADAYDEICHPNGSEAAHTPHEALSLIYARQRNRFDEKALTALVHCLGVYPPGTVVLLNNGNIGIVVAVNSKRPLKPIVLVYDQMADQSEPILIDLEQEAGINVNKTVNPKQLSPEIASYLAVGKRTSYYVKEVIPAV